MVAQIFIGMVAMALGRYAMAQEDYEQVLAQFQTIRSHYWESWLRAHYARLLHLRGDPAAARAACMLAQQRMQQNGVRAHQKRVYLVLGHALTDCGEWEAAENCYQQALAIHQRFKEVYFMLATPTQVHRRG
ncbi:MAG: tetratricopeptide repeat protein [Caldilineaceae bacterium]